MGASVREPVDQVRVGASLRSRSCNHNAASLGKLALAGSSKQRSGSTATQRSDLEVVLQVCVSVGITRSDAADGLGALRQAAHSPYGESVRSGVHYEVICTYTLQQVRGDRVWRCEMLPASDLS